MAMPIPALDPKRLGTTVPTHVHPGFGFPVTPGALVVWSTLGAKPPSRMPAQCVLTFFVDDRRFEMVWDEAERYAQVIRDAHFASVVEPDFSLWADDPLAVQQENVFRTRTLGALWQRVGIPIVPSLNWSTEESFAFAFQGIPRNPPVAACECQTASDPESRPRFAAGLAAAVRAVRPRRLLLYGGLEQQAWVAPMLPRGPRYTLLPTWHNARRALEAA